MIKMLGVRLDKETEERLEVLCKATRRTKSYYAKKAIKEFIEDREDYLLAVAALKESGELRSFEEERKNLGLDN
jgi:RHH-type transcriptional regulator, rel operon repressor / antitoxin RelB